MRLPEQAKLVECGVDWITLTATDKESRQRLRLQGERVISDAVGQGDEVKTFRWKGYEGWTTGHCEVAEREDSTLVRLHGRTADDEWWDCAQEAQNCTRIDYQVTYNLGPATVESVLQKAWRAASRTKLYGKPVNWHYRRDSSKGNTLELGRRASEQFGRAYDKGRESKLDHYANCLRLETEYKGELAWLRMKALAGPNNARSQLAMEVCEFFRARGLDCGLSLEHLFRLKIARPCRTVDTFLVYLQRCVKPGVERAIEHRGIDATLRALGLEKVVQPVTKRVN